MYITILSTDTLNLNLARSNKLVALCDFTSCAIDEIKEALVMATYFTMEILYMQSRSSLFPGS